MRSCPDARGGVAFYRGRFIDWRAVRGVETSVPVGRKPRNCADAHYLAELWPKRSFRERTVTERWLLEQRTLAEQDTWVAAIEEVQKAYPDTAWWLRSCSSSEGAGRHLSQNTWVPNRQGSGAGGWLQFMESTFWRMFNAAKADVVARGFKLADSAASWYSRLGQALAGAWGLTHGSRGEWSGSSC